MIIFSVDIVDTASQNKKNCQKDYKHTHVFPITHALTEFELILANKNMKDVV